MEDVISKITYSTDASKYEWKKVDVLKETSFYTVMT